MLVITVEVWPQGKEKHKKVIGRAAISNDRTGTEEFGNYDAEFLSDGKPLRGKLVDFPRKIGFWWLLWATLNNVVWSEIESAKDPVEEKVSQTESAEDSL